MLRVQGLSKSYGTTQALAGLSLDVDPGQIVGLVGNNGAGKTTTIKLITGLIEPTEGSVELDGLSPLQPPVRRRIGYLPEDSPLYDDMTPRQYMAYFGRIYGLKDTKARVEELFDDVELQDDFRGRPCGQLSKGNQRKVALARALLHGPDLLVFDEPRSGLDPSTQALVDAQIARLRDEGKAIILSAHDLDQVEQLCDHIVVLHEGHVVASDSLDGLQGRLGDPRIEIHAKQPFDGSTPQGPFHVATAADWTEAKALIDAAESEGVAIHDVRTAVPRLRDILTRLVP